eukprot:5515843-Amphidinium_carterae.1
MALVQHEEQRTSAHGDEVTACGQGSGISLRTSMSGTRWSTRPEKTPCHGCSCQIYDKAVSVQPPISPTTRDGRIASSITASYA